MADKGRVRNSGVGRGPAAVTDLLATTVRLMDRHPSEVAVVYAAVQKEMRKRAIPKNANEREAFVTSTLHELFPVLMQSEDVRKALDTLATEYAALPCVPVRAMGFLAVPALGAVATAGLVGLALGGMITVGAIGYLALKDATETDSR